MDVSALSLFNLVFSLLLSSHSLLSPSPLQNGSLYLQRLWAGISPAEAWHGTSAAVSGTSAAWGANKRCPDQTKDQPLCEAGSDGTDGGTWSSRSGCGEKCPGVGPKVSAAAVSLNAWEDTSSYMTSRSHPSMDRLGGGGISFIKRVSVKGFLFLHPSPRPWMPLPQRPVAEPAWRWALGSWAQNSFCLTVGFWVGSLLPPLVLREVGFCSSRLP